MSKKTEKIKDCFNENLEDSDVINIIDNLEKKIDSSNILKNVNKTIKEETNQDTLRNAFDEERKKVSEIVSDLNIKFITDIKDIPKLQSELYTYRQMMVEKRSKLQNSLSKVNYKIKLHKKDAYLHFKTDYDISFKSYQDLNIFIDDYIKNWIEKQEVLLMQISFLEETVNTLDRMIFGVKSRLTVEQILIGNTNY
jgi:hypothetical protein